MFKAVNGVANDGNFITNVATNVTKVKVVCVDEIIEVFGDVKIVF